ncbi:hypothetical protein GCM10023169_27250 [Georgenia halophila]|uniref:PGAP1-like protein n=1 Tax=Georgenia halophila TaxID=620889 RepID=A0ABP8LEA8_9MICO
MSTRLVEDDAGHGPTGTNPMTDVVVTGGAPVYGGSPIVVDPDELGAHAATLRGAADLVDAVDRQIVALDGDIQTSGGAHQVLHLYADVRMRLTDIRSGPTGLHALAEGIRELAEDLTHQRYVYEEAERRASTQFDPPWWRVVGNNMPPPLAPGISLMMLGHDLRTVAVHAGLAYRDVLFGSAPDGVAVQRRMSDLAEVMQYMNGDVVNDTFLEDGHAIDVTGMTSVQRSSLVGLVWLRVASRLLTTQHDDVRAIHVPVPGPIILRRPGRHDDDRGLLGRPVPTTIGRPVPTPQDAGDVLARIQETNDYLSWRGDDVGAVEILRTTTPDGEHRWTVLVPGTKSVLAGSSNPMDMETNMLGMAGQTTDMERAIVQAMQQLDIPPDEAVSLVGHSQGGIVATRLAADPDLQNRYRFSSVLTAGSPVGTIDEIPSDVNLMHLEDSQDPLAGLDGEPNEQAPNRTTVTSLGAEPAHLGANHHLPPYVQTTEDLDEIDHPSVERWLAINDDAMALGDEGARTESFLFEVERY